MSAIIDKLQDVWDKKIKYRVTSEYCLGFRLNLRPEALEDLWFKRRKLFIVNMSLSGMPLDVPTKLKVKFKDSVKTLYPTSEVGIIQIDHTKQTYNNNNVFFIESTILFEYLKYFNIEAINRTFENIRFNNGQLYFDTTMVINNERTTCINFEEINTLLMCTNIKNITIDNYTKSKYDKLKLFGYDVDRIGDNIVGEPIYTKYHLRRLRYRYTGSEEYCLMTKPDEAIILVQSKYPVEIFTNGGLALSTDKLHGFTIRDINLHSNTSFESIFAGILNPNLTIDLKMLNSDRIADFHNAFGESKVKEVRLPAKGTYRNIRGLSLMFNCFASSEPLDIRALAIPKGLYTWQMFDKAKTPMLIVNKGVSKKFLEEQGYEGKYIQLARNAKYGG